MADYRAPLIIRGRIIDEADVEYGGRNPETRFRTADMRKYAGLLPLGTPSSLADLYSVSLDEIVDYLAELGRRLKFEANAHLQEALELTVKTSGLGEPILRAVYSGLGKVFDPSQIREVADINIGVPYLEGWVNTRTADGTSTYVRAFGRGGVIVSQSAEPVEFAPLLNNRIANLVPVDDLEVSMRAVTNYTQTIGIYPDELVPRIRDRLAFHGAHRLVTLGYVATRRTIAGPQDGIEPLRRMCKWILNEVHDTKVIPFWPETPKLDTVA